MTRGIVNRLQVMAKTIFNPYSEAIKSDCEELDVAGSDLVFYSQYIT